MEPTAPKIPREKSRGKRHKQAGPRGRRPRPREAGEAATAEEPKVVESLKAAAVLLGIDVSMVKRAKELGSPAFRPGNRIEVDALRKWIAEHALEMRSPVVSMKDQKTNEKIDEEIRKLRLANDQKEGLLVEKARGIAINEDVCAKVAELLEQKLENEYPAAVAKLSVAEVRQYGRQLRDLIVTQVQSLAVLWAGL